MEKRILIINTSAKISGAERSLIDVIDILSKSFYVILVLPDDGELFECLKTRVYLQIVPLIRIKRFNGITSMLKSISSFLNGTCQLLGLLREHRINIIYSNTKSGQVYAAILKAITGKYVLWHLRDNISRFHACLLGCFANKILCVSEFIFNQVPLKRKMIVYNGVNTDLWRTDVMCSVNLKHELRLTGGTVLIGHIGQLIPWKKHDLLIEVAAQVINGGERNVHFVIFGNDLFNEFPEYNRRLVEKIARSGLDKYISFLYKETGFIQYLDEIDIVLHLAGDEPFGRILIEGMALNKPIIAINSGGPKEIVENNISGFLLNQEAEQIARKLKLLIDDPNLRQRLGTEGRKIVEYKFSLENLKKIQELILSINAKHLN